MRAPPPGTEPLVAGCCRSDMARFKPVFIRSQFTHVYAVVCCEVTQLPDLWRCLTRASSRNVSNIADRSAEIVTLV